MQHKTLLATWVPVDLAERIDVMAKKRGTTRSALVASLLSDFTGIAVEHRKRGSHSDGRDDEALAVIRNNPDLTVRALMSRLRESKIVRGKTWVTDRRLEIRAAKSTLTAE